LFNIENPSLYITVGDNLISLNSITNLIYGNNYQLSCFARNSRPSVSLEIFANGINLNSFSPSTVSVIQSYSQCDSNSFCITGLFLSFTLNDARLLKISYISCLASNKTSPFNIGYSILVPALVYVPTSNFYDLIFQYLIIVRLL